MWTSEGLNDCPIQIGYEALMTKGMNHALHDIYFRSVFDRSFVVWDKKRRIQIYIRYDYEKKKSDFFYYSYAKVLPPIYHNLHKQDCIKIYIVHQRRTIYETN